VAVVAADVEEERVRQVGLVHDVGRPGEVGAEDHAVGRGGRREQQEGRCGGQEGPADHEYHGIHFGHF
jgi:hypothetical protein